MKLSLRDQPWFLRLLLAVRRCVRVALSSRHAPCEQEKATRIGCHFHFFHDTSNCSLNTDCLGAREACAERLTSPSLLWFFNNSHRHSLAVLSIIALISSCTIFRTYLTAARSETETTRLTQLPSSFHTRIGSITTQTDLKAVRCHLHLRQILQRPRQGLPPLMEAFPSMKKLWQCSLTIAMLCLAVTMTPVTTVLATKAPATKVPITIIHLEEHLLNQRKSLNLSGDTRVTPDLKVHLRPALTINTTPMILNRKQFYHMLRPCLCSIIKAASLRLSLIHRCLSINRSEGYSLLNH